MGYVITYANFPIIWASWLQTEIVISTTEAEYVALTQSMRDILPFVIFMKYIEFLLKLQGDTLTVLGSLLEIPVTSHKDNQGVIALIKRLQNQRPTLVVPHDVYISVKDIWIGNVLLLETFMVKFLSATETFWRKYALRWVWGFLIYLFVGSFDDPERGGELLFWKLDAIESRNFIMRSY